MAANALKPLQRSISEYHVFLASPGDCEAERKAVRETIAEFNETIAAWRFIRLTVVDWETYMMAGIGRPQGLITQQTLEQFRESLVLVVGLMAQRFGSPTGTHESGTEEEFDWALRHFQSHGYPQIKWFFRQSDTITIPAEVAQAETALQQWKQVVAFKTRLRNLALIRTFSDTDDFRNVFRRDLTLWFHNSPTPWNVPIAPTIAAEAPNGGT